MKIAVCFKLIADYEQVPKENWRAGGLLRNKPGFAGADYVGKVFGFFDEGALEAALRLKDQSPSIELEAISLGSENKTYTAALYAASFDKVTYLEAESDFDPENTALALSEYIKGQDFDFIFCGQSAGPLDSGVVPYLMAHNLNCQIINHVSEVQIQNCELSDKGESQIQDSNLTNQNDKHMQGSSLLFTKVTSNEISNYEINFAEKNLGSSTSNPAEQNSKPLIAIFSDAKYPYLRFSTYQQKEKTKSMQANCIKSSGGKRNARFALPHGRNKTAEFIDSEKLAGILKVYAGGDHS